jgi:hypothetical protein
MIATVFYDDELDQFDTLLTAELIRWEDAIAGMREVMQLFRNCLLPAN